MSDWLLLVIGYFLGAILGYLICAVLSANKNAPEPHITCKDCVHRNKKPCPLSHFCKHETTGEIIGYHTDKPDDFYCKEASPGEPQDL